MATKGEEKGWDSSSEEDDGMWVPYCDRSGFEDLDPVGQEDISGAPVPIAYTERFTATHDALRAVMARDERSRRALRVTRGAVWQNPANYTAWHYRRGVIEALGGGPDLWSAEIMFTEEVVAESPKNYQLWHHRRVAVENIGAAAAPAEVPFTEAVLSEDSKNYHVWAHRQWVVSEFSLWDAEDAFTRRLLAEDPRNNSAFNHRVFWLRRGAPGTPVAEADALREIAFAREIAERTPSNEAVWSHIWGVCVAAGRASPVLAAAADAAQSVLDDTRGRDGDVAPRRGYAAGCLVDALEAQGDFSNALVTAREMASPDTGEPERRNWWLVRLAELETRAP